jgi:protein-tyrosine phosphatase
MKQVLVVCSANICRSPMVAGLLTQRLDTWGFGGEVLVRSAGTYADPGHSAWGLVRELLSARGIDLSRHRSQAVSSEMVSVADLILVMEEGHRQSIFYLAPRALRKVFLLSELAGESEPLPDVMGQSLLEVQAACNRAEQWLIAGWDQIMTRLALTDVSNATQFTSTHSHNE